MRTKTNTSWWRQLGAVSQGMLFLDGHFATAEAAEAARKSIDTQIQPDRRTAAAARQAEYAKQARQMTALSLFR
jgi:hypothetical protein